MSGTCNHVTQSTSTPRVGPLHNSLLEATSVSYFLHRTNLEARSWSNFSSGLVPSEFCSSIWKTTLLTRLYMQYPAVSSIWLKGLTVPAHPIHITLIVKPTFEARKPYLLICTVLGAITEKKFLQKQNNKVTTFFIQESKELGVFFYHVMLRRSLGSGAEMMGGRETIWLNDTQPQQPLVL